jgi:hypothetical protein
VPVVACSKRDGQHSSCTAPVQLQQLLGAFPMFRMSQHRVAATN